MDPNSVNLDTNYIQLSAGKYDQHGPKKSGFNLEAYFKKKLSIKSNIENQKRLEKHSLIVAYYNSNRTTR